MARQVADLPAVRADAATAALGDNGGCVLVDDLDAAVAVANRYAPEHLQVAVADGDVDSVVDALVNAGEILVGQHTPFSAANFVIGCPASLPTSGFAEVSSGITVDAFLKRTAIARADAGRSPGCLRRSSPSPITRGSRRTPRRSVAAAPDRDRSTTGSATGRDPLLRTKGDGRRRSPASACC